MGFWIQRLVEKGVAHDAPARRFGETALAFKYPDETRLALTSVKGPLPRNRARARAVCRNTPSAAFTA
jgi:hypothetical protein